MNSEYNKVLQNMKDKIEKIEKLAFELKELGQGIPAVEKNSRSILCAVYILKFGISDISEIECENGGL